MHVQRTTSSSPKNNEVQKEKLSRLWGRDPCFILNFTSVATDKVQVMEGKDGPPLRIPYKA